MKNFILISMLLTFSMSSAHANGPWKRLFQDISIPTQEVLEHDKWLTPIVATTNNILPATTQVPTAGANVYTQFSAQPDYPRNITITPGGSTGSVGGGTVKIIGTNILGYPLTESITMTAASSSALTGLHAFKTIKSIQIPQTVNGSPTFAFGVGSNLGLRRCMDSAGKYVFSEFNKAYETTRGTAVASGTSSSDVSLNTFNPHGTMDGSTQVDVYYIQNFRCYQ